MAEKTNEGRRYTQHGISLSFSMENVAQGRWAFGWLSAAKDYRSTNLIGLFQEVSE